MVCAGNIANFSKPLHFTISYIDILCPNKSTKLGHINSILFYK